MDCAPEDLEEIVRWLGLLRESGEYSSVRVSKDAGSYYVYARTDVLLCIAEKNSWLEGLEIGGDVRDLNILTLAQKFHAAMEKDLYTGVWLNNGGEAIQLKGDKWWKEVVKNSPLAQLSNQIVDLCQKVMILAKMTTQIVLGENTIIFHHDSSAAISIQQKGKAFQESLRAGKEVKLDDLEMTVACKKAFDVMIYERGNTTGKEYFWIDGTAGNCTLADGAGIGNNTMTDKGQNHEICFSTKHAYESLKALQNKGVLEIVQVGEEQLVVVAKPNRLGTIKILNQFGKELADSLRGTNFGENVQAKLDGLSEKIREIEISQLPKPVFIENCVQDNNGSVREMGQAETRALPNISYFSQMKHLNAQDCLGLAKMLKTCQRRQLIVPTQFGTLVLPSEWKDECKAQECKEDTQMQKCSGGHHCEPLAEALQNWNPMSDSLERVLAELGNRK